MSTQAHSSLSARFQLGSWLEPGRLARVLAVLVLLTFVSLMPGRAPISKVWGDEGTFLAMMQSLVVDGDLRFDEGDAARAERAIGGAGHLILQRTADGVAYSKPLLFPLLAAPFYALAGDYGPIVCNVLALALALWLCRAFLLALAARDGDPPGLADLALVGFAGGSVLIPHVFWRMADSLQASLALMGLVLVFGHRLPTARGLLAWRGAPWLGALLLSLLVSMRVSNGLLALVPPVVAVVDRRWRRGAGLLALVALSVLAQGAATAAWIGADNPYRAVRASFTPAIGYPVGPAAAAALTRFEENRASHFTRVNQPAVLGQVLYSACYAWIGRHTGFLVYFPASILLLWLALRRSDLAGKVALAAFVGTLAFYVGWKPGNYFGGDTFLGNRYLLPAYPALLVALRRLPTVRSWTVVWLVTAVVLASAAWSTALCSGVGGDDPDIGRDLCRGSQNHAYAGVFRMLPWESTSRGIEGTRDRYWAGEFVRFVDPWAEVRRHSFVLDARRPPAEMLVAHWRLAEAQVLRVRASTADATLRVDHGPGVGSERFDVGRLSGDGRQLDDDGWRHVAITPRRPWRRHRFWFNDAKYWINDWRLVLDSPEPGATAEIVFVGDPVSLARAFAYEYLGDNWPSRPLRLRLRNTSPLPWEDENAVPVTLHWRLLRPAQGGHPEHRLAEGPPVALPHRVEPGETIELEVPVEWPTASGAYVVEVDLVMEHVAWFADRIGSPVFRRSFEISETAPTAPPDSPRTAGPD